MMSENGSRKRKLPMNHEMEEGSAGAGDPSNYNVPAAPATRPAAAGRIVTRAALGRHTMRNTEYYERFVSIPLSGSNCPHDMRTRRDLAALTAASEANDDDDFPPRRRVRRSVSTIRMRPSDHAETSNSFIKTVSIGVRFAPTPPPVNDVNMDPQSNETELGTSTLSNNGVSVERVNVPMNDNPDIFEISSNTSDSGAVPSNSNSSSNSDSSSNSNSSSNSIETPSLTDEDASSSINEENINSDDEYVTPLPPTNDIIIQDLSADVTVPESYAPRYNSASSRQINIPNSIGFPNMSWRPNRLPAPIPTRSENRALRRMLRELRNWSITDSEGNHGLLPDNNATTNNFDWNEPSSWLNPSGRYRGRGQYDLDLDRLFPTDYSYFLLGSESDVYYPVSETHNITDFNDVVMVGIPRDEVPPTWRQIQREHILRGLDGEPLAITPARRSLTARPRRSGIRRSLIEDIDQPSTSQSARNGETGNTSGGDQEGAQAAAPTLTLSISNRNSRSAPDLNVFGVCAICTEGFDNKQVVSTYCGHLFCKECLTEAIEINGRTCPTCRQWLGGQCYHPVFF